MKIPKIKICGLTSAEEVGWIAQEKADYGGVVLFYGKSKRCVTIEKAKEMLNVLQQSKAQSGERIKAVAVTVSPTRQQAEEIQAVGFDMIQIHGALSKDAFDAVRIPIIRAFNGEDKELYEKSYHCDKVEAYLFDAAVPGSGKTFDWESLKRFPKGEKLLFLAGGLNAANIERAVREVMPDVVDVSSGVEKDSGVGKDREKIIEFVRKVRNGGNDEQ